MKDDESSEEAVLTIGLYLNPTTGEYYTPLTRSNKYNPSKWKIVGGKVKPGETIVQAAIRETDEEVGLEVSEVRLFKSVPKPSWSPMHKEHMQHIVVGEFRSVSGFKSTAVDGKERLTSELVEVKRIRRAINYNGLLSYHEILHPHTGFMEELFKRLFGEFKDF